MNTNPEAQSHSSPLPANPKQSFWRKLGGTSLSISLIFHLVLLVAGVIWVFQILPPPERDVTTTFRGEGGPKGDSKSETQQRVKRMQSSLARISAANHVSEVTLPDIEDPTPTSSKEGISGVGGKRGLGDGGLGSTFGRGNWTTGGPFDTGGTVPLFLVPIDLGKRCSKMDRLARIKQNGGTVACEDAVVNALRWLKANQNADGSWGTNNSAAMTGFALLSYFGHCETPSSEEFGDSCLRGIIYLVNLGMKNDGRIAGNFTTNHWSYEHAIATYALGEASTFCKKDNIPYLREVTEKAGQFIIDNQNENGGWAYLYARNGGHTDVSVAGWQIQALKACSHTDIQYKGLKTCINKGLKYLDGCQNDNGGYGYNSKSPGASGYFTLTGVGMLCNQMWNNGNRSEVRKAAKYVIANTRFDYNTEFCDLYGHYYESQAMMQRGGAEWQQYNDLFRDQLLNNQDADGSWKTPGGGKKPRATAATWQGDKLYRTVLCTLMLEVYYRFLNTGGGAAQRPGI